MNNINTLRSTAGTVPARCLRCRGYFKISSLQKYAKGLTKPIQHVKIIIRSIKTMIKAVRQNKKTEKWEYDYKDLKGKRKIKKGFNTRDEAERALVKHYEELNKGINPINKKTNIKEAGELYLRLHASTNCKPSTYKTYEGYLNNIIVPFFGNLNINEISPILIKEFMK